MATKIVLIILLILLFLGVNFILNRREINNNLKHVPSNIMAPIVDTVELPEVPVQSEIPKIIYRAVKDSKDIDNFKMAYDKTKLTNPNYKQIYYGNDEKLEFVKENFSNRILDAYNNIRDEFGPAKADLFRYLLIYLKGGIYLDGKSATVENLDKIIENNDKLLVSKTFNYPFGLLPIEHIEEFHLSNYTTRYGEYSNWYVISPAGNIALKNIIIQTVSNIELGMKNKNIYNKSRKSVLFMTGPIMYSKVIEKNKEHCKIFKPYLNKYLAYRLEDHKNFNNGEHYSKLEDMNILKV